MGNNQKNSQKYAFGDVVLEEDSHVYAQKPNKVSSFYMNVPHSQALDSQKQGNHSQINTASNDFQTKRTKPEMSKIESMLSAKDWSQKPKNPLPLTSTQIPKNPLSQRKNKPDFLPNSPKFSPMNLPTLEAPKKEAEMQEAAAFCSELLIQLTESKCSLPVISTLSVTTSNLFFLEAVLNAKKHRNSIQEPWFINEHIRFLNSLCSNEHKVHVMIEKRFRGPENKEKKLLSFGGEPEHKFSFKKASRTSTEQADQREKKPIFMTEEDDVAKRKRENRSSLNKMSNFFKVSSNGRMSSPKESQKTEQDSEKNVNELRKALADSGSPRSSKVISPSKSFANQTGRPAIGKEWILKQKEREPNEFLVPNCFSHNKMGNSASENANQGFEATKTRYGSQTLLNGRLSSEGNGNEQKKVNKSLNPLRESEDFKLKRPDGNIVIDLSKFPKKVKRYGSDEVRLRPSNSPEPVEMEKIQKEDYFTRLFSPGNFNPVPLPFSKPSSKQTTGSQSAQSSRANLQSFLKKGHAGPMRKPEQNIRIKFPNGNSSIQSFKSQSSRNNMSDAIDSQKQSEKKLELFKETRMVESHGDSDSDFEDFAPQVNPQGVHFT